MAARVPSLRVPMAAAKAPKMAAPKLARAPKMRMPAMPKLAGPRAVSAPKIALTKPPKLKAEPKLPRMTPKAMDPGFEPLPMLHSSKHH